jgi:hypothetical protein
MSRITIWLHELEPLVPQDLIEERFRCFEANEPVPRVELDLTPLDDNGQAMAPPTRVYFPPPQKREHAVGDGTLGAQSLQPPLGSEIKQRFHSLKVGRNGEDRIFERSEVTDDKAETRKSVRLTAGGSGWVLVLVAELFERWDDFHAICREFVEYVLVTPPFSDPDIKPLIGFELLFAPSGEKGLFGTHEAIRRVQQANADKPEEQQDRRIFGNNKSVGDFLKTMRWRGKKGDGSMVLVVVNSTARGGAGGAGDGTPTWTTVTGGANEDWKDVALHEMGHAFGLADEYFAAQGVDKNEPRELEPNISRHADGGRAPWAEYWADRSAKPWLQPSSDRATLDSLAGTGLDLFEGRQRYANGVGTFQGARYDATKYYRPAFDCRMHHTNVDFCLCCQRVIRDTIKAGKAQG